MAHTATTTATDATTASKKSERVKKVGLVFLGVSALLLVRNVLVTFNSLDANPGIGFFELFFVTTDEYGDPAASLALMVWTPFILAPIGLVLALISRVMTKTK
ncbi:hypothetical protein [Microbacterium maritypicum]|uniref:hypothetical protein n=1 Tax=Microbacterium maritypicum TaxID=33918 RepID=UPI003A8D4E05